MAAQPLGDGGGQLVEHRAVEHERHRVEAPRPVRRRPGAPLPGARQVVDEVAGERRRDDPVGLGLAAGQRSVVVEELRQQLLGRVTRARAQRSTRPSVPATVTHPTCR